jgi:hypothetical protein
MSAVCRRLRRTRQARYQEGIQCLFVATVPWAHLTAETTPWLLERVRWGK